MSLSDLITNQVDAARADLGLALPAAPPAEDLAELVAAADALNGLAHGHIEVIALRYVEGRFHALVPPPLIQNDFILADIRGWALRAPDRGSLLPHLLPYQEVWRGPAGVDFAAPFGTPGSPFNLRLGATILICAVNVPRYSTPLSAAIIAVAFSLGLYSAGDDGYTREYAAAAHPPAKASMEWAVRWFTGVGATTRVKYCMDILAYLGYCRISHTHPVDSTNQEQLTQHLGVIERMGGEGQVLDLALTVDHVPHLLHAGIHGASLGGAVGFFLAYRDSNIASPYITARRDAVGDLWKSVAIAISGYDSLMSMPTLGTVANASATMIAGLRANFAAALNDPLGTSSLCALICGQPSYAIPDNAVVVINVVTAMICAGVDAGLLAESYKRSYYLNTVRTRLAGAVAFWTAFFSSMSRRMSKMTPADMQTVIALAAAPLGPPPPRPPALLPPPPPPAPAPAAVPPAPPAPADAPVLAPALPDEEDDDL